MNNLLTLQERERQLMAYEIHDGLAQHIATALLHLQSFAGSDYTASEEADKSLQIALHMLRLAGEEARRLMAGLRPATLDSAGVVPAVEELIWRSRQAGGPKLEFEHKVQPGRWDPLLETTVFRIVQESLTNALRHSRSGRVRVELVQYGSRLRLTVRDWGVGFDPHQEFPGHLGLRGIVDRTALFKGQVAIHSEPGQGTRVVVELPLAGQPKDSGCEAACEDTVRIAKSEVERS